MRKLSALLLWVCFTATAHSESLHFFDLTQLNELNLNDPVQARKAWDTAHLVASVQGIVNRGSPTLFVRFKPDPDDFWWSQLRSQGQWLAGRTVVTHESIEDLLATFDGMLTGVVAYDDRVWATSNLASTIAGVEDRICLRMDQSHDSVYQTVMRLDLRCIRDSLRLVADDGGPLFTGTGTIPGTDLPSTGSAKNDAYLWAKSRYLDQGCCSEDYMAYYVDAYWLARPTVSSLSNATLTNHDFFISQRAFFFDLNVWEEESPVDDPDQIPGSDLRTLKALLKSLHAQAEQRIIHIGGFTPWAWKYTDHPGAGGGHGPVDTEWKYAQVISEYNGIMDADALGYSGMANASFYQHHPLREHYPQNPRPTLKDLTDRGLLTRQGTVSPKVLVCFYMGDYDSAAWLNHHVPRWWQDPAHEQTLCAWAFNPNLDRRAPHAMHYVRTHQTRNDWFMFGDSGAGYLNPGMLLSENRDSGLPDALDTWATHCADYGKRYDLSITGFIIDGHSPSMGDRGMDAYARFSPDGIVGQKLPGQGVHRSGMPHVRMKLDLQGNPQTAGAQIASLAGINGPKFLFLRTILKSPSWHQQAMAVAKRLEPGIEFVDPYSFFELVKQYDATKQSELLSTESPNSVVFTAPSHRDGLAPILLSDGPYTHTDLEGHAVLRQRKPPQPQYLYFEVADRFAAQFRERPSTAVVIVEVLDNGSGRLAIQYDGTSQAYAGGSPQRLTGSGKWLTLTFTLDDPVFEHRQNGGADFRLVNWDRDLCVRRVVVQRK